MSTESFSGRARRAWNTIRGYEQPRVSTGELAWSDPYWYWGGRSKFRPYNPDKLVTAKGLFIYDEMRRDDQIKASLAFKKQAVLATGWTICSAKGPGETDEVTDFVTRNFTDIEGTLESALLQVLSALDYGFSVSEKVFVERENKVWLKALKTRRPHPFEFEVDSYGNTLRIIQQGNPADLTPSKFLVYRHQYEFGNPYGTSDLNAAYRAWWSKDNAYKWLGMMLEKYGIPPVFAKYNQNVFKDGAVDKLKTILERMQAATLAVVPVNGKDDVDFWAPELAGQVSQVFTPALAMFNQDIARAILMPGFLGVTPDTQGSYARAKVIFDIFMFAVEYLRKDLANAVNESIVQPLVELNFAEDAPSFQFLPLTAEEKLAMLESWVKMVSAGAVHVQPEDEAHIREKLDFPQLTPEARKKIEQAQPKPDDTKEPDDAEGETTPGAMDDTAS